jgi:GDSL-like Lipase/Acylhydrolase family
VRSVILTNIIFIIFCTVAHVYAAQPPVIPVIDVAMKAQLQNIYRIELPNGRRSSVFAKVGDSITQTNHFLNGIGCDVEVLAGHQSLARTIRYFRNTKFPPRFSIAWCDDANSFTRYSAAAFHGWTAAEVLAKFTNPVSACPSPFDNPLRCEFRLIEPSIALIMFGTNDLEQNDPKGFRKNLTRVVQETIVDGVIPVLSTIPPRLDNPVMGRRVGPYNAIIEDVADRWQIPLWNYWLVLQGPEMINQGMDTKGIHPNVFRKNEASTFTAEALRYGFNQRNLTAVEILKKLRSIVQKNDPADQTSSPNFTIFTNQLQITASRGTTTTLLLQIGRNTFQDPIRLRVKGAPSGIAGTFQSNPAANDSALELRVRSDAPTGDYRITIQGTAGALKRTTTLALQVTN